MKSILFLCLSILSSCAPYNTKFTDVSIGMERSQVTGLLGKPMSKEGFGNQEVLHYRLASSILDTDGSDTREYWVRLTDGRVDAYGERNDAAALMRSERQYRAAWGTVGAMHQAQQNQIKQQAVKPAYTPPPFVPISPSSSGPTSGQIVGDTVYFDDGSTVRRNGNTLYIDR